MTKDAKSAKSATHSLALLTVSAHGTEYDCILLYSYAPARSRSGWSGFVRNARTSAILTRVLPCLS